LSLRNDPTIVTDDTFKPTNQALYKNRIKTLLYENKCYAQTGEKLIQLQDEIVAISIQYDSKSMTPDLVKLLIGDDKKTAKEFILDQRQILIVF